MRYLSKVIGGQSALLLELLDALQDELSLDPVYRDQLYILTEEVREYFGKESSVFKRLEYVAKQTQDLLNVSRRLETVGKVSFCSPLLAFGKRCLC